MKFKDVLVHATKLYVRVGVVLTLSYLSHYIEVGSHFHAPTALPPGKEFPFPIEYESVCVRESF